MTGNRVGLDRWDLLHLLLSADGRGLHERDRAALEAVARRVVAALAAPPPPPFTAPGVDPVVLTGWPLWIEETNAWVLAPAGAGGECLIVDSPPDPGPVLRHLARHRLRPAAVAVTHGHTDHAAGVAMLVSALEAPVPVLVHPADRAAVVDPAGHGDVLGRCLDPAPGPPPVVEDLVDGRRLRVAGTTVRALHCPGHTPGSTCLLAELPGGPTLLFSGDVLFAGGAGRTDLAGGCYPELLASVARRLLGLHDTTVVLPGHGRATTMGAERAGNPVLVAAADGPASVRPAGAPAAPAGVTRERRGRGGCGARR